MGWSSKGLVAVASWPTSLTLCWFCHRGYVKTNVETYVRITADCGTGSSAPRPSRSISTP